MPHLSIQLLGPPTIEIDGKPISVDTRKAIALLAYLAVTGKAQSRSTVAALLWPESDEVRAKATLRRTLAALNNAIGKSWLIADRNTLTLPPQAGLNIDIHRFSSLVNQCPQEVDQANCEDCLPYLQEAVALYRGDFLAGFTLSDSTEFDDWQAFYSETYRRMLSGGLKLMMRCYLLQQDYELAIQMGRRWLALDPLHEPAHRAQMELFALAGQRSSALRQYEECVQLLDKELGVPPQPETAALYEQIIAGVFEKRVDTAVSQPTPKPPPKSRLPQQLTSFVGRDEEMTEIEAILAQPNGRLVTIIGSGGTGKTRLALEVAKNRQDKYSHGVYFVPLAPVSDVEFLVVTIAETVQYTFYGGSSEEEQKAQLLNFLREKEMLLVLDNFEHLLDGASLIDELLQFAPGIQLLITSQERLNLVGESLVELYGLQCPPIGSEHVESCSAVSLFVERASQVRTDFSFNEAQAADIAQICRLVSGLPLGIELASTWIRMLSCQEIVQQIERDLDFLATTLRNVPQRHRSLRAVFEHSWRLLSDQERAVFGMLSVFRGGFSLEAAGAVADASLPLLLTLTDKSLIQRNAEGQYEIPEILRQYGAEKLAAEEKTAVLSRHTSYFMRFLRVRETALLQEGQAAALAEISATIENVRQAWRQAIESRDVAALDQAMEALYRFYQTRSWFKEGSELFAQVADVAEQNSLLQGKALSRQGRLLVRMSQIEDGRRIMEESLAILRPLSVPLEVAAVQSVLGVVSEMAGNYAESRERQEESRLIYHKSGEVWGEANVLLRLGNVAYTLGEFAEARRYYQDSMALRQEIGDKRGLALCLNNLGSVADTLGEYEEAGHFYRQSMELKRAIGDRRGMAYSLNNLGHLGWLVGEYQQAHIDLQECLQTFREIGDQKGIGFALTNLGNLAFAREDFARSLQLYQESLAVCREIGYAIGVAYAHNHMGQVYGKTAAFSDSLQAYQAALAAALEVRATPVLLEILVNVAMLFANSGQAERAARLVNWLLAQPAIRKHAADEARQLQQRLPATAVPPTNLAENSDSLETAVADILQLSEI